MCAVAQLKTHWDNCSNPVFFWFGLMGESPARLQNGLDWYSRVCALVDQIWPVQVWKRRTSPARGLFSKLAYSAQYEWCLGSIGPLFFALNHPVWPHLYTFNIEITGVWRLKPFAYERVSLKIQLTFCMCGRRSVLVRIWGNLSLYNFERLWCFSVEKPGFKCSCNAVSVLWPACFIPCFQTMRKVMFLVLLGSLV